nr:hypothetical protein [Tanacetum cinerariifolium]
KSASSPVKIQAPKELPKITPTKGECRFENTKVAFLNEIILFLNTLKDIFNVFDKDLLNEVTKVQSVFNQMEADVQQCFVDKQCFKIHKKELFLENDRLLHQIMSQDIMICVMNSTAVFDDVNLEMQSSEFCVKCLDLDVEILNKENAYNDLSKNLKGQIEEKVFVKTTLQNELRKLKGKNVLDNAATITNATTIAPGMFKLDLDPLAPRLLKNRDAHIDYLKYTQEQAEILKGIVKQAKAKQPLDNALDFACKHSKRIQKLLVYVRDTFPTMNNPSQKLVVVTPMNKVKKARFLEPLTSLSNIHKQVVHLKETTSNLVETQKPEINVYSRRPKQIKTVGSSKKAKIVESKNTNNLEPNHSCESNATYVLSSSSLVNDRLSILFSGADLLSGPRDTNLYTISLDDMLKTSSIYPLSKASKTKSLLWHPATPRAVDIAGSPSSTTINLDVPSTSSSSTNQQQESLIISQGVKELIPNAHFDDPCHEPLHDVSTSLESSSNVQSSHSPLELIGKWTKDHPLANLIGNPS